MADPPPYDTEPRLAYSSEHGFIVAWWCAPDLWFMEHGGSAVQDVTHYMELPEAPK